MAAAWQWLSAHPQPGDVYLSADIYKHPTFMFLNEQTPTSEYFTRQNPRLHWFDARFAWPLPSADAPHVTLLGDSALPPSFIADLLRLQSQPLLSAADHPLLQSATTDLQIDSSPQITFTERLSLLDQHFLYPAGSSDQAALVQIWQTSGSEPQTWQSYQMQSALLDDSGQQMVQASDLMHYRPPEWRPGDLFLTWQTFPWSGERPAATALRLVPYDQPPLQPPGATDGWVTLPLVEWKSLLSEGTLPS